MQKNQSTEDACASGEIAPLAAADFQDHLMAVTNDLNHLQSMVDDACETLMEGFLGATRQLRSLQIVKPEDHAAVERAVRHLDGAAKALQVQDMSTQLITHTSKRLRHCADRLAAAAFGADGDGTTIEAPPSRPNPVTQAQMDTGFIELF